LEVELLIVEGIVVLGLEKFRRPPALPALKFVPLRFPKRFKMKKQLNLFHRIDFRLNIITYLQSLQDKLVHIEIFHN
jgi:hypothetical protein